MTGTTLFSIGQTVINPPIRIGKLYCHDSTSEIGLIKNDIQLNGCHKELANCDSTSAQQDTAIAQKVRENETNKQIIHNDSIAINSQKIIIGLQKEDIATLNEKIKQDKKDKRRTMFKGLFIGLGTGISLGVIGTTLIFIKL